MTDLVMMPNIPCCNGILNASHKNCFHTILKPICVLRVNIKHMTPVGSNQRHKFGDVQAHSVNHKPGWDICADRLQRLHVLQHRMQWLLEPQHDDKAAIIVSKMIIHTKT